MATTAFNIKKLRDVQQRAKETSFCKYSQVADRKHQKAMIANNRKQVTDSKWQVAIIWKQLSNVTVPLEHTTNSYN